MKTYDLIISGLNSKVAFAMQTKFLIAVGFGYNPGFKCSVSYSNTCYTIAAVNRFSFKLKNGDPATVHFIHLLN